jgi:hypothetical protein
MVEERRDDGAWAAADDGTRGGGIAGNTVDLEGGGEATADS